MKRLLVAIVSILLISPAYAAKDFAKRFPTDTAMEVYTPNNPPPAAGSNVGIGSTVISGTTGSVLFVGAGPVFAQDNANFFWDDTGNNLGIGTTIPQGALTVMNGNVGIGTWVPNTLLHLKANANTASDAEVRVENISAGSTVQSRQRFLAGTNNVGALVLTNPTTAHFSALPGFYVSTEANGGYTPAIGFAQSTNVRLYLPDSSSPGYGNLGIGTTVPKALLELNGNGLITGTSTLKFGQTSAATIGVSADTTAGNLQLAAASTGEIETLSPLRIRNTGSTFFPVLYAGAGPSLSIELEGSGNSGLVFSQSAFSLDLAAAYRFVANGGIYAQGNVGIGSSAPKAPLNILQANAADALRVDDVAGDTTPFIIDQAGNVGVGSLAPGALLDVLGASRHIGSFIQTGGNVGIGTPNLAFADSENPFLVYIGADSNARVRGTSGTTSLVTYTDNGSITGTGVAQMGPGGQFFMKHYGSSSAAASRLGIARAGRAWLEVGNRDLVIMNQNPHNMYFGNDGETLTSPAMTITPTNNIGIGTTAPSSLFEVGVRKFNVQSNGNVGIGSTAPGKALDVNGDIRLNGTLTVATVSDGTPSFIFGSNTASGIVDTVANMYINADSDNSGSSPSDGIIALGFNRTGFTGGTEVMRLLDTGNVGIGSITPGVALDVQGTIRASTGTAGQAVCWKADKSLGQCTTIVGATGDCTCS